MSLFLFLVRLLKHKFMKIYLCSKKAGFQVRNGRHDTITIGNVPIAENAVKIDIRIYHKTLLQGFVADLGIFLIYLIFSKCISSYLY